MRRVRLLVAMWLCVLALAPRCIDTARAQTGPKGTVTIFTDSLAYPYGRVSRALTELSAELDKTAKLRILPIMANGGESNIRDLLRFRGADFVIVNSDAVASPAIDKAYPEVRRKLRYVTRLNTQKIYLLARADIASVDQLRGKKIAVLGSDIMAGQTAATVFGLLKVNAQLVHSQDSGADGALADAQAVFLLEDDAKRLLPSAVQAGDFHLLPIPPSAALAAIYSSVAIQPAEAADYAGADPIETIAVDTVLATFDWATSHSRYADVARFIDALYAALPKLQRDYATSIWREADPFADVPNWRRYVYAETARRVVPPVSAKADSPLVAKADAQSAGFPASVVSNAPGGMPLRLSVVTHPPLTDQRSPGGGLIGELVIAAMERAERPYNRNVAFQWEKDKVSQIKTVLSDKSAELGAPWEKPSCDDPPQLGMEGAAFCDGALASDAIFKELVLFFMSNENDFSFSTDETMIGRTICLPSDRDVGSLGEVGRKFVADGKVALIRPPSLIACLDAVQRGEADAVLTNELEGKLTIGRLGLSKAFRMSDRAVSVQDVHVILAKDAPGAEQLLAALNKGISKLKSEDLYFRIVAKHLSQIDAGN